MTTSIEIEQIQKQYLGFLKIPTIFRSKTILRVMPFETQNINSISFNSEDIELINKHLYLGKRAEHFMWSYLKAQDQLSNVMHSIQIQNKNTTLGEADFLFYNKDLEKWVHLELVTKFYIYNSDEEAENYKHWIGPNLKDTFEYKLEKLKHHQLLILNYPEAQNKLKELNIDPKNIETQICYKAKLFLPTRMNQLKHTETNVDCVRGSYFNLEHFKSFEYKTYLYYVPQKQEWVCAPELQTHWYNFEKALEHVKLSLKDKRSCLLWRKTSDGDYFEDFVVWWC